MSRGGVRAGAGRKPGTLTKRTREAAEKLHIEGENPLDFLLQVMRNPEADFDARFEAAKAAAPYVHPRLQAVEMKAEVDASVEVHRIELVAADVSKNDDHTAH